MTKTLKDFTVKSKEQIGPCCLLTLKTSDGSELPQIAPGQFVEVQCETPGVMLRRPISVCNVSSDGCLILLVKSVGKGSEYIVNHPIGGKVNILLPLGNGFSISDQPKKVLLVGGGVGAAPLSYLAYTLAKQGSDVTILIGARSASELNAIETLYPSKVRLVLATDDGSLGHHGLVTTHPVFEDEYEMIYSCGPTPMMRAVAHIARERNINCEVSLENRMACGLGACLCCVEKTTEGHLCVCTEGPVFNINRLLWN